MTRLTDEEWQRIQEALVRGGLRQTIDNILEARENRDIRPGGTVRQVK